MQKDGPSARFEPPLVIRVMAIDGTWCADGLLFEISDSEALIELTEHAPEAEFFLMLTQFGNPVFRHCRRKWVQGAQIGVSLKRTDIKVKSTDVPPEQRMAAR
jgi:hypothetical protein